MCSSDLHLFFAALWGGGATTMVLLFCLFHPSTAHEQITFSKILFYIDFIIVGPGAGGCLATGLIYSLYGNWGFFKFRWITLKYVINILFITYGMLVFLPFTHGQYSYYLSQPTEAIIPEESIWMNIFCTSQNFCTILMFLFVVYLSVFKSVKKKNRERPRPFTTD
ncbi:hypothetical protein [Bilophila wadsworthia]|uniref:hypothetical protein n=1 Tax=Bilophila wadsworthia TaxID=35833 RepID=UPI00307B6637